MTTGNEGGSGGGARGAVGTRPDADATEAPPSVRVIDLDGMFDEAAATATSARLLEPGWDVVILDFHGARDISDTALFLIASAAGRQRSPVVMLRGLGHHHQRVLRYLDVNVVEIGVDDRVTK